MIHWETINGEPLALPITIAEKQLVVDPIPVSGGILNGMGKVGFDQNRQVVLSYEKYDASGRTQLYLARFENGAWRHYQASDWKSRIEFQGGGSLPNTGIGIGAVAWKDGRLILPLSQREYGGGTSIIDPRTMKLAGKLPANPLDIAFHQVGKVESAFPGMEVHWAADLGTAGAGVNYRLRWETLPANRDRPRDPPWPPASMLRVVSVGGMAQ
jgi:hypothetical protein